MNYRESLILILLAAIWGASFIFMRMAVDDFGIIALIQIRIGIGAACLLPFLWLRYSAQLRATKLFHAALIGLTNSALPFSLLAFATSQVSAGYTSLLNASVPVWSAIIAALWLKDWLSRWQIGGIVLSLAGMGILVLDQGKLSLSGPTLAIIACTAATISYGFSANYTKRFLSDVPPLFIAAMSLSSAALLMLPLSITYWPSEPVNSESWAVAIALGTLCTGLAYMLFYHLIKHVGPTRTVSVTFLIPVFGVFWGFVFLNEVLTAYMVTGSLIIFSGTALVTGLVKPNRLRDGHAMPK